jgi:hypothetical protein
MKITLYGNELQYLCGDKKAAVTDDFKLMVDFWRKSWSDLGSSKRLNRSLAATPEPPAPTPEPPAPTPEPPAATPEPPAATTDADGLPHDLRIHSAKPTFTKDGKWRRKRGVTDETFEQVRAELLGNTPLIDFATLMNFIAERSIDLKVVNTIAKKLGHDSIILASGDSQALQTIYEELTNVQTLHFSTIER